MQMDIDATSTSAAPGAREAARRPSPAPSTDFARVFDLAAARRRRLTGPERIPDEVWADIDRAGQLADDLAARGQHVRFESHRLTGRVVVSLCDTDGRLLRPLSLRDLLGTEPDPSAAA
jgi:hypothetical protein